MDGDPAFSRRERLLYAVGVVLLAFLLYVAAGAVWNAVNGTNLSTVDLLNTWDAGWYRRIVRNGYQLEPYHSGPVKGQANWAFFPLYPLLVWFVHTGVGLDVYAAGALVSGLCLATALYFTLSYVGDTRDRRTAVYAAVLLGLGPYAFYSLALYTESLFLALTALGFWCLRTRRYAGACVVAGLLSATRPTGAVFGLAIAVSLFRQTDVFRPLEGAIRARDWRTLPETGVTVLRRKRVLALALVPAGLFAYMAYLWLHVGNPLAFAAIQSAWDREFGNPLWRLASGLWSGDFRYQYLAGWSIFGFVLAGYLAWRDRVAEATYGALLVLVPLSSGLVGMPRYVYGTGVLYFAAAEFLGRRERFAPLALAVAGAGNVLLLWLWFATKNIVI